MREMLRGPVNLGPGEDADFARLHGDGAKNKLDLPDTLNKNLIHLKEISGNRWKRNVALCGFWSLMVAKCQLSSLLDPHICKVQKCRPFVMAFGASYPRGAELSWHLELCICEVQNCHGVWSLLVAKCKTVIFLGASYLRSADNSRK